MCFNMAINGINSVATFSGRMHEESLKMQLSLSLQWTPSIQEFCLLISVHLLESPL